MADPRTGSEATASAGRREAAGVAAEDCGGPASEGDGLVPAVTSGDGDPDGLTAGLAHAARIATMTTVLVIRMTKVRMSEPQDGDTPETFE